jgi:predicted secreted protein
MKKIHILLGTFLLIAALSSAALAGDYAQLQFIGFSTDGRFLAFEEFGVSVTDMRGYSTIFFVNTEKNSFAAPAVSDQLRDSELETYDNAFDSPARRRAMLKAGPTLRRLKIVAGNTGRQVISRPLTDVTNERASPYEPKSVAFAPDRRESMLNGRYYLKLLAVSQNQFCKEAEDPELVRYTWPTGEPISIAESPNRKTKNSERQKLYSFDLSLTIDDLSKTIVLQKAGPAPAVRGCAVDYRIQSVYMYRDKITVFIGVFTPGFLGDNVRLMAVTGTIGGN